MLCPMASGNAEEGGRALQTLCQDMLCYFVGDLVSCCHSGVGRQVYPCIVISHCSSTFHMGVVMKLGFKIPSVVSGQADGVSGGWGLQLALLSGLSQSWQQCTSRGCCLCRSLSPSDPGSLLLHRPL